MLDATRESSSVEEIFLALIPTAVRSLFVLDNKTEESSSLVGTSKSVNCSPLRSGLYIFPSMMKLEFAKILYFLSPKGEKAVSPTEHNPNIIRFLAVGVNFQWVQLKLSHKIKYLRD